MSWRQNPKVNLVASALLIALGVVFIVTQKPPHFVGYVSIGVGLIGGFKALGRLGELPPSK